MKYVKYSVQVILVISLVLSLGLNWRIHANRGFINSGLVIGDTDNNLTVSPDGFVAFNGTARSMIELPFDVTRIKGGGINAPSENKIGISPVLTFAKNVDKEALASIAIPHRYANGTSLQIHLHWIPSDNNSGDVTWGIEYHTSRCENDEVLTETTTTVIVVDSTQNLEGEHLQTDTIPIDGANILAGDFLHIRIFRDADASEAGASDDYNNNAHLLSFDLELMINRVGADVQW